MKKRVFAFILTVAVAASFAIMPAIAANLDKEFVDPPKAERTYDDFEATDEPFGDDDKPAGFVDFIGGGTVAKLSGMIVENGVGGRNSLLLYREVEGTEPGNLRIQGLDTTYSEGATELAIQFAFRFKKLGNYGFTSNIEAAGNAITDWGDNGTKNWLAVRTESETGKATINVRDNEALVPIKEDLQANTDYVLTAVFTIGTNKYTVAVNNEVIGTYTYHSTIDSITGLRFDDHGYAEGKTEAANLVDEIYFNDIKIGEVVNKSSGGTETPTDPTPKPGGTDQKPNTNTGDTAYLVVVVAMAAVLATVVFKKRANV